MIRSYPMDKAVLRSRARDFVKSAVICDDPYWRFDRCRRPAPKLKARLPQATWGLLSTTYGSDPGDDPLPLAFIGMAATPETGVFAVCEYSLAHGVALSEWRRHRTGEWELLGGEAGPFTNP